MNKTVICSVPMSLKGRCRYSSDDKTLPVSEREVCFPINAFLEMTAEPEDELNVILLVKEDGRHDYQVNTDAFKNELAAVNEKIGARITYSEIVTPFEEDRRVHERLLAAVVDKLTHGSHILCDMTYGPKDVPVVLFTALNFADRFLDCKIDNILYGQAHFVDQKPVDTKICDMVPLFYLGSVVDMIRTEDEDEARKMLKILMSV